MTYQDSVKYLKDLDYTYRCEGFIDIAGVRHKVEYWLDLGLSKQAIIVHNTQVATVFKEVLDETTKDSQESIS